MFQVRHGHQHVTLGTQNQLVMLMIIGTQSVSPVANQQGHTLDLSNCCCVHSPQPHSDLCARGISSFTAALQIEIYWK
ncbi:hypothetical protein XBO1_60012 [Xenorhabdus bovienii str. oregonense]|uniref:Uncharacterized protein n=1 Tax=Xenorhabdus bovienii str. oregonense TaxID=1398202 RepID=A0A077PAB3_XENBV|nr:hypothetical protein XBO1_60012 [Xenorhabdus bovienii str. oregonense]